MTLFSNKVYHCYGKECRKAFDSEFNEIEKPKYDGVVHLAHPVKSPCTTQCEMNSQDVCLGCFRTKGEIKLWKNLNDLARECVLHNAANRRPYHDLEDLI